MDVLTVPAQQPVSVLHIRELEPQSAKPMGGNEDTAASIQPLLRAKFFARGLSHIPITGTAIGNSLALNDVL